jgi:hypothetical protein
MFCPECETEYREGVLRCSDCDVALVADLSFEAPSTGLLPLMNDPSSELIAELLDRLEKAGVPYVIEAGTALSMLIRDTASLEEPEPWHARVWVVSNFEDRAKRIAHEVDEKFGRRRLADES